MPFGSYHFFPLAFEKVDADRAYQTERVQNGFADFFDAQADVPVWRFNLAGLKVLADYIDEWDAFHDAVKGQQKGFLFRLMSRRFEIKRDQPGGIGTTDGHTQTFQLVKTRSYPNGPANKSVEVVKYPHHLYPPMSIRRGNGDIQLYDPTERVRIWVGNAELALNAFDVAREGGAVTIAPTYAATSGFTVAAECKFWVLCHGQDFYPSANEAGSWTFGQGAQLFQVASEV